MNTVATNKKSWFENLISELALIKKFNDAKAPLQDGEQVLGEMSELAKKLFTLSCMLRKEAGQAELEAKYGSDADMQGHAMKKQELEQKANALKEIMFTILYEQFNAWDKSIGLRVGFQVVVIKGGGVPDFIKFMGGGGNRS